MNMYTYQNGMFNLESTVRGDTFSSLTSFKCDSIDIIGFNCYYIVTDTEPTLNTMFDFYKKIGLGQLWQKYNDDVEQLAQDFSISSQTEYDIRKKELTDDYYATRSQLLSTESIETLISMLIQVKDIMIKNVFI